ncbi:cytochrome P450 2B4-like isoform X2 [Tigriopus californicus]|uniref:cytochrome P450 2B4-like isoform X2 n=1 Tax=Tigriopus californicus TaxID=6832 RepID=UPI0027D9E530|nr:cytochrome P450 2B4-like isoform X2 [Tigriopus californicus]
MIFLAILILLLLFQLFKSCRGYPKVYKGQQLPPGPNWSLPLIGHLYLFQSNPIDTFMEMAKTLGGVFMFDFGPKTSVILLDPVLIDQAMKMDALPSRPLKEMESQALIRGERNPDGSLPGIAFADGTSWKDQRKFAFTQLISMGFGRNVDIEEVIRLECDAMVQKLKESSKEGTVPFVIDTNSFIGNALNVVWHFVSGNPVRMSDELLLSAKDFMRSQKPGFLSTLQLYSPLLMRLTTLLGQKNMLSSRRDVDVKINEEIDNHKRSFDPNLVRDFIDAYLKKIQDTTDPTSSFHEQRGEVNMRNSMFDLFIAGMDTTATTLSWGLIYMMKWPEIQVKVRNEIARVIGNATPSLNHRSKTPYVEATLLEIQRLACIVPWGPRATLEDVQLGPYIIPKNTHVLYIIQNLTHNSSFFPDPYHFNPERFLSDDGTKFIRDERVATFGLGKRKCPGENMARMELYLFFVTLMKNFEFTSVVHPKDMNLVGDLGLVMEPKPCSTSIKIIKQ